MSIVVDHDDPRQPGYLPEFDGNPAGLNVGSGSDMGADLYYMYKAGYVGMPEYANVFSTAALYLNFQRTPLDTLAGLLEHSAPSGVRALLEVLQDAIAKTASRTNEAGIAIVQIADRFVRTDAAAAETFQDYYKDEEKIFLDPPPDFVPPSTSDDAPGSPLEPGQRPSPGG